MNPQTPQPFLPLDIPIQGTNLIEASAGTGKTWGIAALFARLILLEHYPVDSVLVVTFTKAATAELKSRLRGRLEEALACLKSEKAHQKADPFLQELLAAAEAKEGRERLLLRLKAALSQFDNAAIYTIHGFCQRILRDYAFLCQAPFEVELSEDTRASLLTPLQDFWRETVAADREKARLAVDKQQTPASVLALMGKWASKTDLVFRRPESTDLAVKRAALAESCCVVRDNLDHIEKTFWEMYPKLSGTKIKKEPTLKKFADLRDLLDGTADAADFLTVLQNSKKENAFHSQLLADCVKKGNTLSEEELAVLAPLTDLYAAACELETGETDALIHLQLDSLETLRNASEQRKKNENRRSFDDLLQDVYAALTTGQHAETLAHTVASLWKVALIDEFQDTDTLQYGIFRKIFIENGNPLFLVGDPKQAIYAFRGADIHAYLQAAEDAQNHYSLDTNRRSHRALIDGISLLFRQKTRPFVLQGIDYPKVSAHRSDSRLLPAPDAAVTVRWLLNGSNDTPNKEELRSRSADFCADEIAGLLHSAGQGRLKMQRENGETTPLQAGEIAVLVRSHKEG
ncbi:MAG: UvrD-helicase domain-containing protein, partial [Neisseria sp.]|nr:UvrD-helicase domain-containing protein [Neisseria sp.]